MIIHVIPEGFYRGSSSCFTTTFEVVTPDAVPEVRKKYRIARKLRKFDDCFARNTFGELADENVYENLGEGGTFCVKWAANLSLQELESKKDIKKLTAYSGPLNFLLTEYL